MRTSSSARSLRLADGRRLCYGETGPRDGVPVLYCHGAIGTALEASVDLEAIAFDLGVRHIAVSRPGLGGSDPSPGRRVLDFASDLRELADALGVERFHVVGVSAGGPYALAAAHELADRVLRVAACSSLSPLCAPHRTPGMRRKIRVALALLARHPDLCGSLGDLALPVVRRHPELLSRVIAAHAAASERAALALPAERHAASASFLQAAAGGVGGMIEDYLTYAGEWSFTPEQIAAEVHLWHGAADPVVPIEHALQLAVSLPSCRLFVDPDEGHHFFRRRLGRILGVLIGRYSEPGESITTSLDDARALAGAPRGRQR